MTFKILGMNCTSCAINIDGELEEAEGIKEATTNYAKQITTVKFDPGKVSPEKIITIIRNVENGYDAEVLKKDM